MKFSATNIRHRFDCAPTVLIALLLAFASNRARAQMYGVHFEGSDVSVVTGTAGVVPIAGWNNFAGANVTGGAITSSDGLSQANFDLTSTAGTFHSNQPNDGSNGSLTRGYIDAGKNTAGGGALGSSVATVSGLTAGATFDVYIYDQGDTNRPGNNGDFLPNYTVNGTTLYTAVQTPVLGAGGTFGGFTLGGTQATNTNAFPPPVAYGNYIVFSGVVATGGTITISPETDTTTWRSPFNGFELIAVPEPSSLVLLGVALGALVLFARRRLTA